MTEYILWASETNFYGRVKIIKFFVSEGSIVGKLTLRAGVKTIGKINAQFLTQVSKPRKSEYR